MAEFTTPYKSKVQTPPPQPPLAAGELGDEPGGQRPVSREGGPPGVCEPVEEDVVDRRGEEDSPRRGP